MARLFERTSINGMELENRFVRSATWEGMATDDGACTPRLIDLLVELASGGVGLIISSHAYVSRAGQAGPWQLGVDRDKLMPGLQDVTEAVHRENGKIVLDDNALYLHPELEQMRLPSRDEVKELEAKEYGLSFVQLDGNVGCMVNGAGLAMATMDLILHLGGTPANFLDIGGSSSPDKVIKAMELLVADPRIELEQLMEVLPGPDFPTAGQIQGMAGIRQANHIAIEIEN